MAVRRDPSTQPITSWEEVQEFGSAPFRSQSLQTRNEAMSQRHSTSRRDDTHLDKSTTLTTLPAELLLATAQHLPYPDLLALRHTHPRFLNTKLLSTSNRIHKVDWLVDRKSRGLSTPERYPLRLDSDAAFCNQVEVREIMQRRLRHGECVKGPAGCLLVEGRECGGPRRGASRARRMGIGMGILRRRLPGQYGRGDGTGTGILLGVAVLVAVGAVALGMLGFEHVDSWVRGWWFEGVWRRLEEPSRHWYSPSRVADMMSTIATNVI